MIVLDAVTRWILIPGMFGVVAYAVWATWQEGRD